MDIINILHWNSQSILCNKNSLVKFLYDKNIHIAIISETWLQPSQRFYLRGYNIERNDIGNKHNGVAILIRDSISYSRILTYSDNSLQNICVRIVTGNKEISIVSFYSPTNSVPAFNKSKFDALIKSIPEPIIFAGDFNAHHTFWGCNSISPRGRNILEVIDDNNLILLNDGQATTVGSLTWRPNALDLAFVSSSLALNCEWHLQDDPLGSYHLPAIINLSLGHNNNLLINRDCLRRLPLFPNYNLVDWEVYQENVEKQLSQLSLQSITPLQAYYMFCDVLHNAINTSSPSSPKPKTHNKNLSNRPSIPWWNSKCSKAVETSKLAYIHFKNNPSESSYLDFKKLQAKKKLILKIERKKSWILLCESFNRCTPLSIIWKNMRKFNKTYNSNSCDNDTWIHKFLQKYTPDYVSNAPRENSELGSEYSYNSYLLRPFTLQELLSAIFSRKDTAFGLDGIPYKMIKNLNEHCLSVFLNILNNLWTNNEIPPSWKTDCLVPILKPGKPRQDEDSYRPITLTSCIGKIFEQLLKQRVEFHIEKNNILPRNQFGFRKGRSSRESICQLHLDIQDSLVKQNSTVSVFFDIAGAFNSVNIDILSNELLSVGLPQKLIQWIKNFLSDRSVFVKYNGYLYGPRLASIGVCQGGIMSPLIFLLYIRRLNLVLGPNVKNLQFADDLVVYSSSKSLQDTVNQINNALKNLQKFFSYLNLNINPTKSNVVVFGKKCSIPRVLYNDTIIPISLEKKFLGVIMTYNLSWKKYIDYITTKANKAYNILKSLAGTYWGADPKVLLLLYKSLIRSHFEYGFLCFAHNNKLVDILNKIQNKCMRLITGAFKSTPVSAMQIECNLAPISIRFNYLKERLLLKLFSMPQNHPFITTLQNSLHLVHKPLYIMENLTECIELFKKLHIQTSSILPCFEGSFESKFPNMDILIDKKFSCKEEVHDELNNNWGSHCCIFTDGSKNDDGVSFAIFDSSLNKGVGYRLNKNSSVFTAEAVAILAALKHIKYKNRGFKKWLLVSDSMSVLSNLKNNKIDTSVNYIIYQIKEIWSTLYNIDNIMVSFMWVPSHKGVLGNEKADYLAKIINTSSLKTKVFDDILLPYSDATTTLKQRMRQKWDSYYNHIIQTENKGLWYDAHKIKTNSSPWFCQNHVYLDRKFYTVIFRLRFGHTKLNSHLHRLKMVNSDVCSHCNMHEESISHIIFDCPSFGIQRLVLLDELIEIYGSPNLVPRLISDLLVNKCTYMSLYKFILNTIGEL